MKLTPKVVPYSSSTKTTKPSLRSCFARRYIELNVKLVRFASYNGRFFSFRRSANDIDSRRLLARLMGDIFPWTLSFRSCGAEDGVPLFRDTACCSTLFARGSYRFTWRIFENFPPSSIHDETSKRVPYKYRGRLRARENLIDDSMF